MLGQWLIGDSESVDGLRFGIGTGLSVVAYVILATNIHRLILIRQARVRPLVPPARPALRLGIWLFGTIAFALILMLLPGIGLGLIAMVLGDGMATAVTCFFVIGCFYLLSRMSLILPDRAIGHSHSLTEVVGWSKDRGIELTLALCLVPLGANLFTEFLSSVLQVNKMLSVLATCAELLVLIVEIALLSVAYQVFAAHPHAGMQEQP